MKKEPLEAPPFIKLLSQYPEFYLSPGNIFQKLTNVCYYQLGDFCYPTPVMLINFLKKFSGPLNVQVFVQDIRFRILVSPVYKIPSDGAIMSQDVYHIAGSENIFLDKKISENIRVPEMLENSESFKPSELGEIVLSQPSWCQSKYLLEAIIYCFQDKAATNQEIIRLTLEKSLKKYNEMGCKKIALDPLGTEYCILSEIIFVKILNEIIISLHGELQNIHEIIIAARSEEHANLLKKAFVKILNIDF